MKEKHVEKCECEKCAGFRKIITKESALHAFVGSNSANIECDLDVFQYKLEFTNAVQWDVGYCGDPRYYIYRDDDGNLVAWYDRVKKLGFTEDDAHLVPNEELAELV